MPHKLNIDKLETQILDKVAQEVMSQEHQYGTWKEYVHARKRLSRRSIEYIRFAVLLSIRETKAELERKGAWVGRSNEHSTR